MAGLLARVAFLAAGLGTTEIGLGGALVTGSLGDWALVAVGLVMIIAGSAGFMVTLVEGGGERG